MSKVTEITRVHSAGMDIDLVWDEEMLREHQAAALWVPARNTIFLHPLYRANKLEIMKNLGHELIHVLSRYMNFDIDEGTLDSIAQGLVVSFVESGIIDLDRISFGE